MKQQQNIWLVKDNDLSGDDIKVFDLKTECDKCGSEIIFNKKCDKCEK